MTLSTIHSVLVEQQVVYVDQKEFDIFFANHFYKDSKWSPDIIRQNNVVTIQGRLGTLLLPTVSSQTVKRYTVLIFSLVII